MSQQGPTTSRASTPGFSFPSPGKTPAHPPSFADAVGHAKNAMKAYDPAVLRQAIRELWELTLVGSEYHCSFLCSTMFHRAPATVQSRTLELHGDKLVQNSAATIAKHLRPRDLDAIAPILLPKFSPAFLDKALALRLETIQAQQLVNALGRAERLGYDVRDVVTANASGPARQEKVIPTANPIPAPPSSMMPRASQAPSQPGPSPENPLLIPSDQEIMKLGIAFCERCNRPCAGIKALQAHRRTGLCGSSPVPLSRFGREYCLHCGQRFLGGPTGLRYHIEHAVCGQYTDEHADALTSLFADAEAVQKRLGAAAETPRAAPAASQASPGQSPGPSDPYAVLTPNARIAFDAEMAKADQKYADNLKKARELPPDQQKAEFARVKNIYNNKQSVTRKKYGIRLRDRKSRADVEDERNRILSSHQNTPGSTGTRAHSEAALTPTARGELDSISSQATTPREALFSEASHGLSGPTGTAELTNQTAPSATSPAAVSHRSPPATTSGAARPMPMSIAGSYTAPVRPPDRPMNNGNDKQPIEIDDDDDANMDTAADEPNTEMEVDERDDSMQ